MSGKKKILGVVLLLILYVAIALAGFFVAYLVKKHAMPQKASQPAMMITPLPTQAGLQTYTNTDAKVSLQYANTLKSTETNVGFGVKRVELRGADNMDPAYVADIQILTLPKSLAKTIGQDFESYYTMEPNSSKEVKSPMAEEKSAQVFTKVRNRTVNGLRALDYSSVPSPNPDNEDPETGTFVEAGNNLVFFAAYPDTREQLEEILKTFQYQP